MALEKTEITKRATLVFDDEGAVLSAFRTVVTRITDSDAGKTYDADRRDVDLTVEELQTMFAAAQAALG